MKEQWLNIQEKYSGLAKREKIIIFASGSLLICYVFIMLIIEPRWTAHSEQQKQLAQLQQQFTTLTETSDSLQGALKVDVNLPLKQQVDTLKKRLTELDKELKAISAELVDAQQMAALLQDMLSQTKGVKLLSLKSLPAKNLLSDDNEQADLYQQVLKIKLEGRYQDLYQFLKQVETLPWQVNWNNFEYKVIQYPKGQLSVEIITLSLSEGIMGV
ncbi:type II secretion system protein GspM [Catenovulum sediminis]|uniref:Type II secretion system protein GspM n=1 Tax=Catenovulum sediminis TaxID=1740262 RepID=A0ABV1RCH8_9ALTE|nr:type II secretion system protein GspM [Catenovulum sediminis]